MLCGKYETAATSWFAELSMSLQKTLQGLWFPDNLTMLTRLQEVTAPTR